MSVCAEHGGTAVDAAPVGTAFPQEPECGGRRGAAASCPDPAEKPLPVLQPEILARNTSQFFSSLQHLESENQNVIPFYKAKEMLTAKFTLHNGDAAA